MIFICIIAIYHRNPFSGFEDELTNMTSTLWIYF